jgi:hypothetical protein
VVKDEAATERRDTMGRNNRSCFEAEVRWVSVGGSEWEKGGRGIGREIGRERDRERERHLNTHLK